MRNYIHPDQLCIGLYVHLDLGWMDHPFTFSNFKIKSEDQIRKIRSLRLNQVGYDPSRSDREPLLAPTIPVKRASKAAATASTATPAQAQADSSRRSSRLLQLNDIIHASEKEFVQDAQKVRGLTRNLVLHPESTREEANKLIREMTNSVLTESDVVLHAIESTRFQHENYVHELNVAVLALMLAKSLDMSAEDACELGLAAIFHDIGEAESPMNKSFINMHCEIGSRVALQAGLSERIAKIILQHHECVDGSGYPKHLKEAQIDPLARLLAIVNDYENLCNPTNPAEAMTPYEALSHMYVTQPQKYDATLLRLLVKSLGVYPPGSVVQLSDGNYGIVLTVNPLKPLLPYVMLYAPKVARETPVVIDLSTEAGLSIKKCLRPLQLPSEVFDYLKPRKRVCYYFLHNAAPHPELTETSTPAHTGTDTFPA